CSRRPRCWRACCRCWASCRRYRPRGRPAHCRGSRAGSCCARRSRPTGCCCPRRRSPSSTRCFSPPHSHAATSCASVAAATARADPATLYLVGHGTAHLLHAQSPPRIAFLAHGAPLVRAAADETSLVLLGWFRGMRCVLLDLPPGQAVGAPAGTAFEELRPLAPLLAADEAGLLAYARAMAIWRVRHRHCGVCGARTVATRAGHILVCSNAACAQELFPRIDPAIIVLVSDGERALLGRQASWPPRRYSTIAGFVEPGESLEDAVGREVAEETGVTVTGVRYDSSQPWPFPSS